MANGFNPIRWDCRESGCFNFKLRPKIEQFSDCFPRRINFGDVDGIVELGGAFCMLEWKSNGAELKTAQRLLFERLTSASPRSVAFVVSGSAKDMTVDKFQMMFNGTVKHFDPAGLDDLKHQIRRWAEWIERPE